jgi:hypothetical protein
MPDDPYDDLDDDDPDDEPVIRKVRSRNRQLKEQLRDAEARAASAAEADSLRRQLAFRDAGLDMTNPTVKFFAEHYDGDANPDAVKARMVEVGLAEPAVSSTELAEHQQAARAAAGAEAPSPTAALEAEYDQALRSSKSQDEVLAVMDRYRPHMVAPRVQ